MAFNGENIDLLIKQRNNFYRDVEVSFKRSKENLNKMFELAKIYIKEHPNFHISVDTTVNEEHFWEELHLNIWFPELPLEVTFQSCTSPYRIQRGKPFWSVNFHGFPCYCLTGLRFSNLDKTNLFLYYITRAKTNEEIGKQVEAYRQKMSYLNDF